MENRRNIPVKLHEKRTVFIDYIKAEHSDIISWEAHDSDISIFIPDAQAIFGCEQRLFDVERGKNLDLKVVEKLERGEVKKYYYAVYHHNIKDFAVSNSNPAIIIMG
jgi:hypothetical protein